MRNVPVAPSRTARVYGELRGRPKTPCDVRGSERMVLANAYRVNLFAAPEPHGVCAVTLRGAAVVGVAWGSTSFEALCAVRRRVRARRIAARRVRDFMEVLSEYEYSASWHLGLEECLYRKAFVAGEVLETQLAELRRKAQTVGVWWIWPDDVEDGPICISLEEAHRRFAREASR